ncbi:MAG: DNA mismatch repair endonuclease MutL, partial [Clostridia bacterium]|nr:DNA mismatch repair endonuclease MutL [Clostridia bacterium]
MPEIKVLPKNVSELIAAGEVVERPSAVIKELVENAVDAGATEITVEIRRGGILYMSVRDNGCGISRDDAPTAFLRHATSKIKSAADLDKIGTLGFRGEALAAISAVSRTELITRTADAEIGTHIVVEGGMQSIPEDIGCDKGTIIIVRDLFFNTPARMKFLKKDVSEGNSVAAVIDRLALSHPEIAFRFIREGKVVLATSGDGSLKNVIYSVLGRDFATSLLPVEAENEGVRVSGFTCKPVYCKQNRNGQFFFLNGRLVLSRTAAAALEQAYKNSSMVGKFPCCVLKIEMPYEMVDVNVHPAKTEVRFADEHRVFSAVYYAVKNALAGGDTRPEIKPTFNPYTPVNEKPYEQTAIKVPSLAEEPIKKSEPVRFNSPEISVAADNSFTYKMPSVPNKSSSAEKRVDVLIDFEDVPPKAEPAPEIAEPEAIKIEVQEETAPITAPNIEYIGCVFNTYIVAAKGDEVYFIDKHAAHERILFEKFSKEKIEVQSLLAPVSVTLTKEE